MADDDSGGQVVRYSVKELLAEIRDSVHRLDGKLDSKADKADVSGLESRVEDLEDWRTVVVASSEQQDKDSGTRSEFRRWLAPLAVTVFLAAPSWLTSLGHAFK